MNVIIARLLKADELRAHCRLSCLMRTEILRILLRFTRFSHNPFRRQFANRYECGTSNVQAAAKLMAMPLYRGADKSLSRPTSRCISVDGDNISFDASKTNKNMSD